MQEVMHVERTVISYPPHPNATVSARWEGLGG